MKLAKHTTTYNITKKKASELSPTHLKNMKNNNKFIYLDYNASAPLHPQALSAMQQAWQGAGNPASVHAHGRALQGKIAHARETLGQAMGVCSDDIIFTASGTEALNTILYSSIQNKITHIAFSALEHPAISMCAQSLAKTSAYDVTIETIGLLQDPHPQCGLLDLAHLEVYFKTRADKNETALLAVSVAHSETGLIQNIQAIADIVHANGGLLLLDAVQALGKIPLRQFSLFADYIALSAHKIGGPQGVGALYIQPNAPFSPLLIGGGQEKSQRASTMNAAGIIGFGAAIHAHHLEDSTADTPQHSPYEHMRTLRDYMEEKLRVVDTNVHVFAQKMPRLPNTSFLSVPNQDAFHIMIALDIHGISISTGMACSSGKTQANQSLQAMGLTHKAPKGALRISLGYDTSKADIDAFIDIWKHVRAKYLQARA